MKARISDSSKWGQVCDQFIIGNHLFVTIDLFIGQELSSNYDVRPDNAIVVERILQQGITWRSLEWNQIPSVFTLVELRNIKVGREEPVAGANMSQELEAFTNDAVIFWNRVPVICRERNSEELAACRRLKMPQAILLLARLVPSAKLASCRASFLSVEVTATVSRIRL